MRKAVELAIRVIRIPLFLLILLSGWLSAVAQQKILDSLNNQLLHTTSDTMRIILNIDLASNYQFNKSDTALSLVQTALTKAREIGYIRGELRAMVRQGEIEHLRGEYSQAMESELNAIRLSQKYNFPDIEAEALTFLATIYIELADYNNAKHYLFQSKKIYDKSKLDLLLGSSRQIPSYTLQNIGIVYEKLNKLDSAMYFLNKAYNYPIKIEDQARADILNWMGIIEIRKENYKKAINNFNEVLGITKTSNDLLSRSIAFFQLGLVYKLQHKLDSALYFGLRAYKVGEESTYKISMLNASSLLAELYASKGKTDSAFYFLQTYTRIKDSMHGLDEFQKLQNLVLSEQQRVLQLEEEQKLSQARLQRTILFFGVVIIVLVAAVLIYLNLRQKRVNYLLNEKNRSIEEQSERLRKTLNELKSTQSQLIQSEKMASLGELTAGIAHEIQNPLNFVNNFSEVSNELIKELREEKLKINRDDKLEEEILSDISGNLEKINYHGKRAGEIVKSMLQHSRSSTGQKELTDINALCDEYLRLSYHGLRAKDKSFNAKFETHLDPTLPKINVVPQDIGRVILNLINNAFYAVSERLRQAQPDSGYEPTVTLSTNNLIDKIEISVKDNGNGIPDHIKEKIFQPFFTTKPTGQGTGLGLSLSYDIVKAHGGKIEVISAVDDGTTISLILPQ